MCVDECEVGYFLDVDDNTCLKCSDTVTDCLDCQVATVNLGADDVSSCDRCEQGFVLKNDGTCGAWGSCDPNEYAGVDGICTTCPTNCATCDDADTCTSCVATYSIVDGLDTCENATPDGYYLDAGTSKYMACSSNCLVCTDISTCTTCNAGFSLSSGLCVNACGDGQRVLPEECDD